MLSYVRNSNLKGRGWAQGFQGDMGRSQLLFLGREWGSGGAKYGCQEGGVLEPPHSILLHKYHAMNSDTCGWANSDIF